MRSRRDEPELPDDVTPALLDRDVRRDLLTLSKDNAEVVARHLVMAGRLLDDDPELAHRHAVAAQRRAGRIGPVREAAGLTAYATGRHDEALRELRAARRLTGSVVHLPLMADAERGLGRPERALALAASADVEQLDEEGRAEMRIVASGARTDLGQPEAAVVALQGPELTALRPAAWHARTFVAYAEALRAVGRGDEADAWDRRADAADPDRRSGARDPGAGDGDRPGSGAGPGAGAAGEADEEDVVVFDLLDAGAEGASEPTRPDAATPPGAVPFRHDRSR